MEVSENNITNELLAYLNSLSESTFNFHNFTYLKHVSQIKWPQVKNLLPLPIRVTTCKIPLSYPCEYLTIYKLPQNQNFQTIHETSTNIEPYSNWFIIPKKCNIYKSTSEENELKLPKLKMMKNWSCKCWMKQFLNWFCTAIVLPWLGIASANISNMKTLGQFLMGSIDGITLNLCFSPYSKLSKNLHKNPSMLWVLLFWFSSWAIPKEGTT